MAQEVTNFARFYALFNKLPCTGDREGLKKQIVLQYTCDRTESLREMTSKEYEACCCALEKLTGQDEWRQKLRGTAAETQRMSEADATVGYRHH